MSETTSIVRVDGHRCDLNDVPGEERLLDTLRIRLGLTGTKEGCRTGGCGVCTVLVDGESVLSCLTLTHDIAGSNIETIEGAESDPKAQSVMRAFAAKAALQCGYCTPGFVMSLTGALRGNPDATPEELLDSVQGNLCRCTGYAAIRRAIESLEATPR